MTPGTRVFVAGAGGFIGANLSEALTAAGAEVTGFGRRPHLAQAGSCARWVEGDFADTPTVARALQGQEVAYHLVGPSNPTASDTDALAAIGPSIAFLDACHGAGIRKIVFVSSGGTVYGPAAPLPIREDAATDPISAYGIGKLLIEKYLGLYRHLYGLDYAILRVANPYGRYQRPDRGQGLIAKLIDRTLRGEPVEIWGDGEAVRDFFHVDDLSDAMLRAGAPGIGETLFNIGSGIGRSLNEVVADVGDIIGRPIMIARLPGRPADIPANVLDCSRAAEVLGWTPQVSWRDGIERTATWLRAI